MKSEFREKEEVEKKECKEVKGVGGDCLLQVCGEGWRLDVSSVGAVGGSGGCSHQKVVKSESRRPSRPRAAPSSRRAVTSPVCTLFVCLFAVDASVMSSSLTNKS